MKQLIASIMLKLKDFGAKYLQTLMKNVKTNIGKIADGCVH